MAKRKNKYLSIFLEGAVYLLVRTIVSVVGIFPYSACRPATAVLAALFTDILPIRRRVLEQNLQNAFPELDSSGRQRLIRSLWRHLFLMGVEFFIGRRQIHLTNWRRYVEINGGADHVKHFFPDRPLIMITGHYGNFEMGGHILGLLGYPTYSVARRLDNRYLNRYITKLRESAGQYLIEKNGGSNEIIQVIEHRGIVAFLADQSAGRKGCWVEFFHQSASAYKAMALLCLQYNAPILVCHCTRIPGRAMRFELVLDEFFDPLEYRPGGKETGENKADENRTDKNSAGEKRTDENKTGEYGYGPSVFEITQWFTGVLERVIRRHPEQYWWLHRRWKTFGMDVPVEKIRKKREKSALASNQR